MESQETVVISILPTDNFAVSESDETTVRISDTRIPLFPAETSSIFTSIQEGVSVFTSTP